jgi:hypothetical protein
MAPLFGDTEHKGEPIMAGQQEQFGYYQTRGQSQQGHRNVQAAKEPLGHQTEDRKRKQQEHTST